MRAHEPRDGLQRPDHVAFVRGLDGLGFRPQEQRRHQDDRDHEVDHDADRGSDAEAPDRDDAARRERQHAERRRRAGAEERRNQVRHGRLERVRVVAAAPLLVPVLHDVHVVGNREHDDEREEHAGEHVVAVAHQRVEPERPENAGADRDHGDERLAPRSEGEVDRRQRDDHDRRHELPLVVERDAVVGLADLEGPVVVRLHAGGDLRVDDVVDPLDDAGTDAVDAILVEAHHDRGDGRVVRHEIAADQVVAEGASPDGLR